MIPSVRFRNWAYGLSMLPASLVIVGNCSGSVWVWMNVVFSLGILALLESWLGDNANDDHSEFRDTLPKVLLWSHVALTAAMVVSLGYLILYNSPSWIELTGAILSTGLACGSGAVVVAHELIHKADRASKWAGRGLLLIVGNPYFSAHHILVHHVHVGTPEDCVTARKGETLYEYIPRSIIGQYRQARKAEISLQQKKTGRASWRRSHLIQNVIISLVILSLLVLLKPVFALAWLGVSFLAATLLEYVNYIEHYGLERHHSDRVGPFHSWNSNRSISRFLLFDLSRHADHHMHASKPYHCLESGLSSPQLPGGYVQLLYLAIRPTKWFKTVDPLLPNE
ncbi:MAG: fatty acid desaturase [Bacteroidetes bacterium]|nr:fatty acid desaturase [Bacteroidota bacterium]MDA0943035.1 fatty acid desaturase [Bacteroidota bacterium]MDA1111593.1 fatty acid desaturase [Bacteroidota bacterium]